jgi:uncharacterized membrane protein
MEIIKYVLTFIFGFFTILIGDYIWLGYVVKSFTIREFWDLIVVENGNIKVNLTAWLLAWASIVLLLLIFVVRYAKTPTDALLYGALFWWLLYAMYDLTNLTFLKNYSVTFTIVDICWGVFLCSIVSLSMFYGRILVGKFF